MEEEEVVALGIGLTTRSLTIRDVSDAVVEGLDSKWTRSGSSKPFTWSSWNKSERNHCKELSKLTKCHMKRRTCCT